MGEIDAFVDRLLVGPEVLVLHGEAGIGKTTLWREAVRAADRAGCLVLLSRPTEVEGQLTYSGLTDLFAPVDDSLLDCLPAPQRRALGAALLREDPPAQRSDPRAVVAAAVALLRRLVLESPVVVAVDDVQWLDSASFRVLESAVRRLRSEHLGVAVCERGAALPRRSEQLSLAVAPEGFTAVRLEGLHGAELRSLVESHAGGPVSLNDARRIEQVSGGNPFFARGLVSSLPASRGADGSDVPMSRDLREMVAARMASLPETTGLALLAASAMQTPTVARVAVGMDTSVDFALDALEQAADVGVVEIDEGTQEVTFAHPLYAAGVYALARAPVRRLVHRRLAAVADTVESKARHLARSQVEPDAGLACLVDQAAMQAAARGAPDGAAELAVQACRLTLVDQPHELTRRRVNEARFRFHAGELDVARVMLDDVLDGASYGDVANSVAAEALCLVGEIHYLKESYAAAMECFRRAELCAPADPAVACRLSLHLAYGSANTGAFHDAPRHAWRALSLSERVGDPALRAESLASTVIADYLAGKGLDEQRLGEALALEDPFHQVALALRPQLIAGNVMLFEGRLEEACTLLVACRQAAIDRGEESDISLVMTDLAWTESCRGRLGVAEQHAQEALAMAQRLQSLGAEGAARAQLVMVHGYRGDRSSASDHADRALRLAESTGSVNVEVWTRWGLGVLALGHEDPAGAHAALEPLAVGVEAHGLAEPVVAMYLADEIEALVGIGQLDRAEALVDTLQECAARLDRGWALVSALRGRALLEEARGDLDAAAHCAGLSRKHGEGLEHRLEVARTLLVSGVIERRRKHRKLARELLASALLVFNDAGAQVWSRRTREQLARLGSRPPPSDSLTATERRVAELSAGGLTNREVAVRLNISPKTVESNLGRVYRKLAIRSRAELGARVAEMVIGSS